MMTIVNDDDSQMKSNIEIAGGTVAYLHKRN